MDIEGKMTVGMDSALSFAGLVAETAVIALLFYRRVWRTLPVFCVYCSWALLSDGINYTVHRFFPSSYLTTYFLGVVFDSVLQVAVIIELSWAVLRPMRASLPRKTLWVVGVFILAIGAAIWPFVGIHGLANYPLEWRILVHLQQTTSILRILFFVLLAACSQLLSIGWRDRELQVATGLGFYSVVSLAMAVLQSHQGMGEQYRYPDQVVVASYICSLLYWGFAFATKEAERRDFTPQMQNFLLAVAGAARSTRGALAEITSAKPRDPRHR
jgi:hypothetical protein